MTEIRRDVPPGEWNAFVDAHPDATIYHRSEWEGVLRRTFSRPMVRLAAIEDGRIAGVLPLVPFASRLFGRFIASMPFVNYGGVVADNPAAQEALLAAAIEETRRHRGRYLELRHVQRRFDELAVRAHKVTMVLPLESTADAQFAAIDRKLRNQVRKGEKSGLTVRAGGPELAGAFYDVLCENMRDLGSPVHGPRFFTEVLTALPDHSRVFAVFLGETPVAASLVLWHRNRLEVPWASSLRRYNPLCPNILLYWEMLKFGVERGFSSFDFGRSTPGEGTYLFKAQWGAQPVPLHWEYWLSEGASVPDRGPTNPRFSLVIDLWRRLPVGVTRVVGPLIVKDIP
jgi:FemAB-related protein (PEP-CTERM system-associated)